MERVWSALELLGETKQRDTALVHILSQYKEPGDKPLHALGAELWLGQKPICRLEHS